MEPFSQSGEILWMVVVGFLIAFVLAFAVGANDVANSFGTSVGAKILTLKQACIMAIIFESLGALLIGAEVSDTIWKKIVDLRMYSGNEKILMLGEISALISAAVWLMIATMMKIPVSGTHSIVGATMGFSLVKRGGQGIQWYSLGGIVGSWFVSPILAGLVSAAFFVMIRRYILNKEDHLGPALRAMPMFYGLTIFVNGLSVFLGGSKMLYLDRLPWWGGLILSFGLGLITFLAVHFFLVPWQKEKILAKTIELQQKSNGVAIGTETDQPSGTNFNSVNPSLASSVFDLRTPKKRRKEMGTNTGGGGFLNLSKVYRRSTMSASTSMTGLAALGMGSRQPSQAVLAKTAEEPTLPSVAEHHDEHDGGITLEVPDAKNQEAQRHEKNGDIVKSQLTLSTNTPEPIVVIKMPDTPVAESRLPLLNGPSNEKVVVDMTRISPELSSGPAYAGVETPLGSDAVKGPIPSRKTSTVSISKIRDVVICRSCRKKSDSPDSVAKRSGRRRRNSTHKVKDPPEVHAIFSSLQILTAGFTAFAHGGNDVCNAIGPLVALWIIYAKGVIPDPSEPSTQTPFWLLLFGGFGISVGLSVLGRKVIETVGTNLTPVIPSSGFAIGLGTACTVLIASKAGLPISTTHCIVGSVVTVGWLRSSSQVNFRLFRTIIFGWFVTLPVTVGVSAAAMAILTSFFTENPPTVPLNQTMQLS